MGSKCRSRWSHMIRSDVTSVIRMSGSFGDDTIFPQLVSSLELAMQQLTANVQAVGKCPGYVNRVRVLSHVDP